MKRNRNALRMAHFVREVIRPPLPARIFMWAAVALLLGHFAGSIAAAWKNTPPPPTMQQLRAQQR